MKRLAVWAVIAASLIGAGFALALVTLPGSSEPSSAESLAPSTNPAESSPALAEEEPNAEGVSDPPDESRTSGVAGTTKTRTDEPAEEPAAEASSPEPSAGEPITEKSPNPEPEPKSEPKPWRLGERFYAGDSPWNAPIADDAVILPQSREWADALYERIAVININRSVWTPGVFIADPDAPRQTVPLEHGWVLDDVPIPPEAQPSPDGDRTIIIIDEQRGLEYDFFRLERGDDGSVRAVTGVPIRLNGSGWWDVTGAWGARASGAALGGGLIRAEEAKRREIPHALACAAPKDLIQKMDHGVASPATTSDGLGPSGSMPMGTRLQLDPAVDISALGLEPGEKMIAKALQIYGMYIVESTGPELIACYAENDTYLTGNSPYPASWGSGISKELLTLMRVVEPPSPVNHDSREMLGQPRK